MGNARATESVKRAGWRWLAGFVIRPRIFVAFSLGGLLGLSPLGFPGELWEISVRLDLHGIGLSAPQLWDRVTEPERLERVARAHGLRHSGAASAARMRVSPVQEEQFLWSVRLRDPAAGRAFLLAATEEVVAELEVLAARDIEHLVERYAQLARTRRDIEQRVEREVGYRFWSARARSGSERPTGERLARRELREFLLGRNKVWTSARGEQVSIRARLQDPPRVLIDPELEVRRLTVWASPVVQLLTFLSCGGLLAWWLGPRARMAAGSP